MKISATATTALLLLMLTGNAQAEAVTYSGEFKYYSGTPIDVGDLQDHPDFVMDPNVDAFVDMAAGTWGASFSQPMYGLDWWASGGTLISNEGSYALDAITGVVTTAPVPAYGSVDGIMHFTVGPNEIAGLIDLHYSAAGYIDAPVITLKIVNVWSINLDGSLSDVRAPAMEAGPFPAKALTFDLIPAAIPEPSTYGMMLAGLGLVGFMARRRKAMLAGLLIPNRERITK